MATLRKLHTVQHEEPVKIIYTIRNFFFLYVSIHHKKLTKECTLNEPIFINYNVFKIWYQCGHNSKMNWSSSISLKIKIMSNRSNHRHQVDTQLCLAIVWSFEPQQFQQLRLHEHINSTKINNTCKLSWEKSSLL